MSTIARVLKSGLYSIYIASIVCILAMVAPLPAAAQPAPFIMPPRPTTMPPRPTTPSQPTPASIPDSTLSSQPSIGSLIELHTHAPPTGLWTIVQWQDQLGDWHDVEGWQGTLDEVNDGVGKKVWWVAKSDLGKGPFHWMIYQSQGEQRERIDRPLAQSEPFYLPRSADESLNIEVSFH